MNEEECVDHPLRTQEKIPAFQKNFKMLFESVTPRVSNKPKNLIFEVAMKKETGGLVTILRTYQDFTDLHGSLKTKFPEDVPDIPDQIDEKKANEITELAYSLHSFLNKITEIDKIMFSDIFQVFVIRTSSEKIGLKDKKIALNIESGNEPPKFSAILFEIVSANNVVEGDKKFVLYTIMIKKHMLDNQPVFLKRRYSEFYNLYSVFNNKNSHKVFNNFHFPKKSLISSLSQEQIKERAKGLEQFLNLISSCELINSHIVEMFLTRKEHLQAVSFMKKNLFGDAAVFLENIFYIKEKLLLYPSISVFDCLLELTACLVEFGTFETAFKFCLLGVQYMRSLHGHQEVVNVKIPLLRTGKLLAEKIGEDPEPFTTELARETPALGENIYFQPVKSLLTIVRERVRF